VSLNPSPGSSAISLTVTIILHGVAHGGLEVHGDHTNALPGANVNQQGKASPLLHCHLRKLAYDLINVQTGIGGVVLLCYPASRGAVVLKQNPAGR